MKTNLRKRSTRVKTPLSVFLTLIVTALVAPYQVQSRSSFSQGDWRDFGAPTSENRVILQPDQPSGFVRVMSVGRP